jgi:hypothetical protein
VADSMLLSEILKEVLRQMDPAACLQLAYEAFNADDFDEARNTLASYRNWRRRGGFEPHGGDHRADELERMLIDCGIGRSRCDQRQT